MPKLDLTTAKRIKVASGEVARIKGAGFEWVKPVSDLRAQVIAALYSGGRRGFLLDFSDKSTLFQDDAESSPVTAASQQIAVARDISGNGLHFRQTTAGARPLYTFSSGIPCARGDGFDDKLFSAAIDTIPRNDEGMMLITVTQKISGDVIRTASQYNSGANRRVFTLNALTTSPDSANFGVHLPGSFSGTREASRHITNGVFNRLVASWAGADTPSRIKINNLATVSASDNTPALPTVTQRCEVFSFEGSGLFSNEDVNFVAVVDKDYTGDAGVMSLVNEFLLSRMPA